MPVITQPPIIVDPVFFSRPSGGYEQPPFEFQVGTDLYLVLRNHEEGPDHVTVYLSTDNGATWTAQDDSNAPGNIEPFTCFQEADGSIDVCGTHSGAFVIIHFDTGSNTWGPPTASASVGENQFFFYRKTGGDYVVIFRHTGTISYIQNIAGVWDGSATVLVAIDRQIFGGALATGDVAFVFAAPAAGGSAALYRIDASFGVTGPFALTNPWSNLTRPSVKIFGADSVAVAQVPSSGGSDVVVEIGTPLSSPVMTRYPIYTKSGSQMVSYATLIVGSDGALNVFWVLIDYTTDPIVDELDYSIFDGVSTWSAPTVFYDEVANPPSDSVADQLDQFIHSPDGIQLADGTWAFLATMETSDGITGEHCTGFILRDPAIPPPAQTLQLNKTVVGGSKTAADFILTGTGNDSPATVVTGPGPQVGPTAVPAITFDLSEGFGATWNGATGTWASNSSPWNGGYVASAWVCTGGGTMPNDHTIIIPPGANIVCTIVNTAPIPPIPPQPGSPCGGPITPQPATDVQFELRRVYASMKPAPRIPVRGS